MQEESLKRYHLSGAVDGGHSYGPSDPGFLTALGG